MGYEDRKYVILTSSEAGSIDYSKVLETSSNTLRWSRDNSKTFVGYVGSKPSFLSGKSVLTHSQIRTELVKDEWFIGEEPE